MAITATGDNPIVVTGTTDATDDIKTTTVLISQLYWLQATTGGHLLSLQDGNGRQLFAFYCTTANTSQTFLFDPPLIATDGLYCDDMDSGTLYVFVV